jgi:hypothetical protein
VYLIELIKTKERLTNIIDQVKKENNSPILLEKLLNNLQEIENDINYSGKKMEINIFFLVISVEIFFIFSKLSNIIILETWESKLYFLEGIFASPAMRIVLILTIIIISYISTVYLFRKLKLADKIKSLFWLYSSMIGVFNILLLLIGAFVYFFLKFSDSSISWY